MSERMEYPKSPEQKEKGSNVEILLKIIRHGDREGMFLNDRGRERTRQYAQDSGLASEESERKFGAVKAIGSSADPNPDVEGEMGRSLETAHIYANEIAGDEQFQTRAKDVLSYKSLLSPAPYDHVKIFESFLPENFQDLSPEEKAAASAEAQKGVFKHVADLTSPEADVYKREIAGSYAVVIDHYAKVAKRLSPDSKVLMPVGTHGGMMEFLLKYAMVRKDEEGNDISGFSDVGEIGGEFGFAESYDVDIKTDEAGNLLPMKISFDSPDRPDFEAYLDPERINELKEFYEELHKVKE